eukprot:2010934-Prymnesium_polylepis.1
MDSGGFVATEAQVTFMKRFSCEEPMEVVLPVLPPEAHILKAPSRSQKLRDHPLPPLLAGFWWHGCSAAGRP